MNSQCTPWINTPLPPVSRKLNLILVCRQDDDNATTLITSVFSSVFDSNTNPMSNESSVRSVETEGTGWIQNQACLGSATSLPVGWTGPRIVSFLPDRLPEPLQATMLSFGLPPQQVQGGRLVHTGGKGVFTQGVHCEFIVISESICPPRTHRAQGGFFLKVPVILPIKNSAGTSWVFCKRAHQFAHQEPGRHILGSF